MHTNTLPLFLIALAGQPALAQTAYRWVGGPDGRWDQPMNWSPPGVPNGPGVSAEVSGTGAESVGVGLLPPEVERLLLLNPLGEITMGQNQGLLLRGASLNEGLIRLTPSGIDPLSLLVLRENASISGGGTIRLDSVGAEVGTTARDVPWAAAQGQRVVGAGRVRGIGTLDGILRAEGGTLRLDTEALISRGVIGASAGSVLLVLETKIDLRDGGVIDAGDGRVELTRESHIIGGVIRGSGGSIDIISGPVFATETTSDGLVRVASGGTLAVRDWIENNGMIRVGDEHPGSWPAWLSSSDDRTRPGGGPMELRGTGEVVLMGTDRAFLAEGIFYAPITNGPAHTIRGAGVIDGTITNHGKIAADRPGEKLFFRHKRTSENSVDNFGTIVCRSGATIHFETGTFLVMHKNTVFEIDGGNLLVGQEYGSQRPISGGRIVVSNGGTADLGSAYFSSVELDFVDASRIEFNQPAFNNCRVRGSAVGRSMRIVSSITNDGAIRATEQVLASEDARIDGDGKLVLDADLAMVPLIAPNSSGRPARLTNAGSHTITGTFHSNAELVNQGTLSPGSAVGHEGVISGDIRLQREGLLIVDIGDGAAKTDLLDLSGDAVVDGRLAIRFAPGFEPGDALWARTIVTTESVDPGRFAEINAPAGVRVVEVDHEIRAGVSCASDLNLDLETNFGDAQLFVRWFVAGDDRADLAAPFGTLNVFDLAAFVGGLGIGCD